jgi:hypothetical protein
MTFSLHSILKASLGYKCQRHQNKKDLPVLLLQLLYQRVINSGVHRGKNALVENSTIEDLLDSCVNRTLAIPLFRSGGV